MIQDDDFGYLTQARVMARQIEETRRKAMKDAWDEAVQESYERGWCHWYAAREMKDRNPYRSAA